MTDNVLTQIQSQKVSCKVKLTERSNGEPQTTEWIYHEPVRIGIRRRIRKPNKKISVIINTDHVQASRWTRATVNIMVLTTYLQVPTNLSSMVAVRTNKI